MPFSSSLLGLLENMLCLYKFGRNLAGRGFCIIALKRERVGGMFFSKMVIGFSSLWVIPEVDETVLTSSPKDN